VLAAKTHLSSGRAEPEFSAPSGFSDSNEKISFTIEQSLYIMRLS